MQWGGGISMMECQGGHIFPEQRRATQLVLYILQLTSVHLYSSSTCSLIGACAKKRKNMHFEQKKLGLNELS